MSRSKNSSSAATSREPFGMVTELMQVPIVLYEILSLASEIDDPKARQIAKLTENVIEVTLDDPESLVKLLTASSGRSEIQFMSPIKEA